MCSVLLFSDLWLWAGLGILVGGVCSYHGQPAERGWRGGAPARHSVRWGCPRPGPVLFAHCNGSANAAKLLIMKSLNLPFRVNPAGLCIN